MFLLILQFVQGELTTPRLSLNDFHQDRLVPQLQLPSVFSLPIHEMLHLAAGNRILLASQAMLAIFLASL